MPIRRDETARMVREFRKKYLFPIDEKITSQERLQDVAELHDRLFNEEYTEFWQSYFRNDKIEMLDAVADCLYILVGLEVHASLNPQMYKFYNSMTSMFENVREASGFNDDQLNEAFVIVHESNMSKGVLIGDEHFPVWEKLNPSHKELFNSFMMDYMRGTDLDKWREMEKGKLMKGDTFKPPILKDLV